MFYPSAKIIIEHPKDKNLILMVKRHVNGMAYYEPAGGKVEIDFTKRRAETLEQCVLREAYEELGLRIVIDRYIGSYYFFWTIDPHKGSSCAVFVGTIADYDEKFISNHDSCELKIEPTWVLIDNILNEQAPIDPSFVGLKELITEYCQQKIKVR